VTVEVKALERSFDQLKAWTTPSGSGAGKPAAPSATHEPDTFGSAMAAVVARYSPLVTGLTEACTGANASFKELLT